MTAFTIEIDASGVEAALAKLVPELDRQLRDTMDHATDVVTVEAKQRAPQATTALHASIMQMPVEGSFSGGSLTGGVTATVPYAMHVEYGTRPHEIRPRKKKALRWPAMGGTGGWAFAKRVKHPGTSPQPFMAPAWDARRDWTVEQFRKAVRRAIKNAGKG